MYSKSKPRTPSAAQLEAIERRYEVKDGQLIVKNTDKTRMPKIGLPAGTINSKGHLSVTILKSKFRVAHIIWFMSHGFWPSHSIAHRDGNKTNNSIENLVMLDLKAEQT